MGNSILMAIGSYLVKSLTEEKVTSWSDALKSAILPAVDAKKGELISFLSEKAKDASNPLAEAAVSAFDTFLDAFMPDKPTFLK